MLPSAFNSLSAYHQFIVYKLVPDTKRQGKTNKYPVNPETLEVSDAHNMTIWVDWQTAYNTAQLCGSDYGVGFVFTENDPFFFVDIDNAFVNGQWSQLATDLCNTFVGAAIEISQSGTGLHIIGCYNQPLEHGCKNVPLGLELYTEKRFVALTGTSVTGDTNTDCTVNLQNTINQYFPPVTLYDNPTEWRDVAVDEYNGFESDDELINKAMTSGGASSVFGNKATFKDLWTGDVNVLSRAYPSLNDRDPYDRSSADAALAQHLAFWTGKNHERVKQLMLKSALVRDKWEKHGKYLGMTVGSAVSKQKEVYKAPSKQKELTPVEEVINDVLISKPTLTAGDQFLTPSQQVEYFDGCVYIRNLHRIMVKDGGMLKSEQFKASMGGYEFAMDSEHNKTTKSAYECFTESKAVRFPQVTSTCFRPEIESRAIIDEEGEKLINTYIPIKTKRTAGDVTPFLNHMVKLLPDERDREIVISYMAACVQYPGVKFQWCPLIQGTEGNGKTLITRVVAYSVGQRYTHLPNAKELGDGGSKFTAWLQNKLFIGVEEIYVSDRKEVSEALKVLITNDRIEIQGKGQDQVMGDNRANFIMCSNHKDALHVTVDSRRYAVFYTAQQTKSDKYRDGMTGSYFPDLYKWLNTGGYAIVNEFLHTYQINEQFNPSTICQEAPSTSSTEESISLSLGGVEQEVLEAIDEGRSGFAKGWISSMAFDKLLVQLKAERRIPVRKRRELLQSLGYDWHPALLNGRVNNPVPVEGGKPKIFIKDGHICRNINSPGEVLKRYMDDQNYPNMVIGNVEQR